MSDCIFCGIAAGEIPSRVVALDGDASARALGCIAATARSAGVAESGYRVITDTGPDAGQEAMHLLWHVIGGTPLGGTA
jgi:diadenosine tetraphosphate (Ap4A) HIT family hydrolase